MKQYDLIVVGTGSAMNLVEPMIQQDPKIRIAVIDKDEPGGICLTRGCIPSKILLYPAELVRTIEKGRELGVSAEVSVDFGAIMKRMRTLIDADIETIREGLSTSPNIDYYHAAAEFTAPYTMAVADETVTAQKIFLCTGSRTATPSIKGVDKVGYHTSDTVLRMTKLPESITIVGGGYIAAEYGHFFSSMGSKVTVIGRNPQFLPGEEPEISAVARRELEGHMTILTGRAVTEVREEGGQGETTAVKMIKAEDAKSGRSIEVASQELMVACGREPLTDILHPERAGIKTDERGWIVVNEYLETSQPNVWAFGDADGRFLFKHVANYESQIVYYNAVLKRKNKVRTDYRAVPRAVFTYPEVAAVGLGEKAAVKEHGEDGVLIGFHRYQDTAKGEAMNSKGYFVKVIVERESMRFLGAHIVGPYASILIQEIVNLMYSPHGTAQTLNEAMHIHPALSEVVDRAVGSLMPVEEYRHLLHEHDVLGGTG